jgi:hypothetical protein
MEVHHHAHTSRKKWTHYFWEFLMLFLAVFCGFLAEYQLEHKIEKEKGKQYVKSFYKDLVTDTSTFNRLIAAYEIKLQAMKTEPLCYDSLSKDLHMESCFWNLVVNSSFFPDLIYTDRTLQQLKNAGGLRLLNAADADSILLYDNLLKSHKTTEETSMQETQADIRNTMYSLLDHRRLVGDNSGSFLYANNKEVLNRYFNQLTGYTANVEIALISLKKIKKKAEDLIIYFNRAK